MSEIKRLEAELAEFERQRQTTLNKIADAKKEMACNIGEALISLASKGDSRWKLLIGEIASSAAMKRRKSEAFKDEIAAYERFKGQSKDVPEKPVETNQGSTTPPH